ncbi:sensor histidine kinase [Halobacteriovorax sp.]|uniref:sensor histidine kinase n=1 Tax=Halobacteriovorax sp. TaxID=2020862 RepID=UPI003561458F
MRNDFNLWGFLQSEQVESEFLESRWNENKKYTFLTYFLCCFFFLLAGLFGDLQRVFHIGSYQKLMVLRVLLATISVVFYFLFRKAESRPRYIEYWLDAMKYLSTAIIVLLTYWTKGSSLTLLPGIMMMVIGFYMVLPGRVLSTNICAIALLLTFTFLQDASLTYGVQVHRYMIFMLFAIEVLLCTFKAKHDKWERTEYLSKKELDVLNKTKDKLMATIGHDIRSPLAIILSRAEISIMCIEEDNIDEAINSQNIIIKSISKLDRMLSDIVEWALSDLKEGKDTREVCCIKNTVENAIDFVQEQAKEKKVDIVKDIEAIPYFHESRMLTTCFRNIISNAIKYNPFNSKIIVKGKVEENSYRIEFHDEGPGMSDELVENIKRGINSSSLVGSEGERGTGLGLKLVKNVIERHKGEIDIVSCEEGGTIFTLILPITNGDYFA